MSKRHGLTLVEVLASAVLLAVIATASLPVLRASMTQLDAARSSARADFGLEELATAADFALADPAMLGVASTDEVTEEVEIPWPDHPERPPIVIRRLGTSTSQTKADSDDAAIPAAEYIWFEFVCAGWMVYRLVPVQPAAEEEQTEPRARSEPGSSQPDRPARGVQP